MAVRIAINGFGRIGRLVFRAGYKNKDVEFVAVNDLADAKTLAHLLKYDSIHGTLNAEVKSTPNAIMVDGKEMKAFAVRDPETLPWRDIGVDVVLESTGRFTDRDGAEKHLKAGAKKVVISATLSTLHRAQIVRSRLGVRPPQEQQSIPQPLQSS